MPQPDSEESTEHPGTKKSIPVVTISDLAMDWFAANRSAEDSNNRPTEGVSQDGFWRTRPQVDVFAMLSGAWLLQHFLADRLRDPSKEDPHSYFCYQTPEPPSPPYDLKNHYHISNPEDYLHTFTRLDKYDRGSCDCDCEQQKHRTASAKVYRIKTAVRYYGPKNGGNPKAPAGEKELCRQGPGGEQSLASFDEYGKGLRLYVIFDGGDGFRSQETRWDQLIPKNRDEPLYIVLFQKPPFPGDPTHYKDNAPPLWKRIRDYHRDRTILVISGDSLRDNGVNISRSLSWERTAQDFLAELRSSTPILKELAQCKHLVVRFGLSGAIHYSRHERTRAYSESSPSTLYYDPRHVEDEYRAKDEGGVSGLTAMLAATVARAVADGLAEQEEADLRDEWVARGANGLLVGSTVGC
jgi:hypothetical protein